MTFMPQSPWREIPIAAHSSAKVPAFIATFMEALRESRRCQAAREIRRYQHLVEEALGYGDLFTHIRRK